MEIDIQIKRKEIVNDILVNCNIIARSLQKNPETEELAGELMTPDDEQTKPVVARALTEAFGEVKRICQKYLVLGRYRDDNRLERIDETNRYVENVEANPAATECKYHLLTGIPYTVKATSTEEVKIMDDEGSTLAQGTDIEFDYTPVRMNECLTVSSRDTTTVAITYLWGYFGHYEVRLDMPECFNISMTETVKSCTHRMMVDYAMYAILKDQYAEKAKEYAAAFTDDQEALRGALRSRVRYRRPFAGDWS